MEKQKDEAFIDTILSQSKLRRQIQTVSVEVFEIEEGNLDTCLEMIRFHYMEEMIGIIRVFCKFDHRIEKINYSAASFQNNQGHF